MAEVKLRCVMRPPTTLKNPRSGFYVLWAVFLARFGKTRLGTVRRLGDQVRKSRLEDTIDDQGGYRMEIGRSEVREEQNKD